MCVKDWKRIAEREAMRYREHQAFMKGVRDADGIITARYSQSAKWVLATEYVLDYLQRNSAEKERFFRLYYGIDGSRRRPGRKSIIALSQMLYASPATLYRWRNEVLTLLLFAAVQTGALRPYAVGQEP